MKKLVDNIGSGISSIINGILHAIAKVASNVYSAITFIIVVFLGFDLIKLGDLGLIEYITTVAQDVVNLITAGGFPLIIVLLLIYLIYNDKMFKK